MRKLYSLLLVLTFSGLARAQDAALAPPNGSITSPVSGCSLSSTENVTVRIFNFGPGTITTPFNVSYSINGGPAVTELVAAPNIPANTSFLYTFVTQADLTVPGSYTIDATVTLPGDPTPGNNTYSGYVVNSVAPSAGGTIAGATNVCSGSNAGALTLSGHTGNVLRWEYSIDGGTTWLTISNTTASQNYNNLTDPTRYRAVVQNGTCATATSAVHSISVDPASVGGTVTPATASVCSGLNSGNLTLGSYTGSILYWQSSIDGGATWTTIANTTATQSYTNLITTTRYRAAVKSGTCGQVNSSITTITVSPATVGGTLSPATATVCSGTNTGNITLAGHTGSVVRWEFSTNGGASWTNVANTTTSLTYTNLTATRIYRARIQSGPCSHAYSSTTTVTVTPATVAGTISADATVCSGSNSGTITLAGNTGSVVQWESSVNGGSTWTPIANTTTSEAYNNLTATTQYRAEVQNGTCSSAYTNTVTITVTPASVGGSISGGTTVCSGSNNGTLTLSGYTGTIQSWEYSKNDGATWSTVANTTPSLTYTNLDSTTIYHAIVVSGVCPADTADSDTVIVDPVTVGGTIAGSATVCYGSNSGTLTLSGETGTVVEWELSTDNGLTWISITNSTTSQTYTNLTTPTMYRVLVQSGICAPAYSATATIGIDPASMGGTIYGSTTVCSGSNSGTLSLIGHSGSILNWEESNDGVSWSPLTNTAATFDYSNLTDTTHYRAVVQSGVCPADTSSIAIVYVDANSVGGLVSGTDTVCEGANSGILALSGQTGTVMSWEISNDLGVTWLSVSNTTTNQGYSNLNTTTMYRTQVKNGVCSAVNSSEATVTVDRASVGGTIASDAEVCSGTNGAVLTLGSYRGTVQVWEASRDSGLTWMQFANTTDTLSYSNLDSTTWYRAVVVNGTVCPADTSALAVISVVPVSVGGSIAGTDTVCAASNSGTLRLTGFTGEIQGWEFSSDGSTWLPTTNTTDSLTYNNLGSSRWFRVRVKSGICSSAYSDTASVIVDPAAEGGTVNGSVALCEGASGTVTLTAYTGTVQFWQSSANGGASWDSIANTTPSLSYSGLTDTTWYRAVVISGTCGADTSSAAIITIYPKPVAGFSAPSVCDGSATQFTDTTSIATGSISFHQWSFGDGNNSISTNPVHIYADTGTYAVTLIVTSNNNCRDTVITNVTVNPLPSAAITSGATEFCSGDTTTLSVTAGTNLAYLWSTGDTTASITVDSSGVYSVTVTDTITLCSSMDSITITVFPLPVANAGVDTTITLGRSIQLNATGGTSYLWTPATGLSSASVADPVASPAATTEYVLTVTDENGCTDMDSIKITVESNFDFMISNTMTPNGDGFNDTWYVENIELYTENQVTVINRNGQEVFSASSYDNTWAGTYNGSPLPDGTYYYVIKFTDTGKVVKGAITILRNQE